MLGQVQSALGQVDQLRTTAERGIHFAKTAQAMLAVQVDLIVRELFAEPEMQEVFGLVSSVGVLTEKLAAQADPITSLPETLRAEAHSLIDTAMARVSAERTAAITQALEGVARERTVVLGEAFERVSKEREATLDAMFRRVETVRGEVTEDVRTLVREERIATLEDAFLRVAEERKVILQEVRGLVAEERAIVLEEMGALVQSEREAVLDGIGGLTERAFGQLRGLLLLAAALAAGLLVLWAVLRFVRPGREGRSP